MVYLWYFERAAGQRIDNYSGKVMGPNQRKTSREEECGVRLEIEGRKVLD